MFQATVKGVLGGRLTLENILTGPPGGWSPQFVVGRAVEFLAMVIPFVGGWAVALPMLRLRRPRPPLRRLLRQPGMTASFAAALGLAWSAAGLGGAMTADLTMLGVLRIPLQVWLWHFVSEEVFPYLGLAVASAWLGQAMAGRWRPVPDWIDRMGRALGLFWIVAGLIWACRRYLDLL